MGPRRKIWPPRSDRLSDPVVTRWGRTLRANLLSGCPKPDPPFPLRIWIWQQSTSDNCNWRESRTSGRPVLALTVKRTGIFLFVAKRNRRDGWCPISAHPVSADHDPDSYRRLKTRRAGNAEGVWGRPVHTVRRCPPEKPDRRCSKSGYAALWNRSAVSSTSISWRSTCSWHLMQYAAHGTAFTRFGEMSSSQCPQMP